MRIKIKTLIQRLALLMLVFFMTACHLPGLPGSSEGSIKIAGFSNTEGNTMLEIVAQLIEEETDYEVERIRNLGSGYMMHQALRRGDADISAINYTGNDYVIILGYEAENDPTKVYETVRDEYRKMYNWKYYPTYGFENTYAFVVTEEFASENNLQTVSDLEVIAGDLKVGTDPQWPTRTGDGYPAFKEIYGFEIGDLVPMNIDLVYDALISGSVDAIVGYTTDGRIPSYGLTVLEDDRGIFPAYDAVATAKQDTLDDFPGVDEVISRLEGKISTEKMQEFNYEGSHNLREPVDLAREFLKEHNYFRD